ncbi:efflux RND transporter periplasmic adaptor subunit [Novosphingobium sp. FSW06-99]|uniref:efflux RND transporter periplasmic adaptor subunit n=1 Tax=Novosphingobium sp. FSW06-99 TaxID=1739113 RepID=UPI0009E89817|nr:efflux RND transporter periplasmic adaptor subunit [Novosphingobium sp. FSW06-99]
MQDHVAHSQPEHPTLEDSQGHPASRSLKWIIGAIVLIVIVLVVWHIVGQPTKKPHNTAQVVTVGKVTQGDMPVTLDEIGTVTPTATVTVLPNASVSGYLIKVAYQEGQTVTKGQLLAEIDPRPYEVLKQQAEAALAKDQATLDQARYDFGLYSQLNDRKAIATQTFGDQKYTVQQAMAAVQQDKANIAQYALDIQYCYIRSPADGRAGLRLVDVGNYVTGSSSTGIVVITTVKPMLVQFGVAQNDIGRVTARFSTPGVKLPVTALDSGSHQPIATGTLYAISNQMNTSTGQTPMRATFPNDDLSLWPNAFVNVRMLVDTLHNATLVPTPAILTGAPGTYVYVANADHTVSVRKIAIGPSDGINTVVTSGLRAGETVVTDGTDRLSDGTQIRVGSNKAGGNGADSASGGHKGQHKGTKGNAGAGSTNS